MEHQSDADGSQPPRPVQPLIREDAEHGIDGNDVIGVQRMIPDAHAVRVEERVSQQMVQVNHHRGQHDQVSLQPASLPEEERKQGRHNKVQPIVRNRPERNL